MGWRWSDATSGADTDTFGLALELIRGLKERNPRKDGDFRHDIWRWKGHDFAGALHDRVRRWIDAAADPGGFGTDPVLKAGPLALTVIAPVHVIYRIMHHVFIR